MRQKILKIAETTPSDNYRFVSLAKVNEKTVQGALKSYARGCPREKIIAILDSTLFHGGKNGFILTEHKLYGDILSKNPLSLENLTDVKLNRKSHLLLTYSDGSSYVEFFSTSALYIMNVLQAIIALRQTGNQEDEWQSYETAKLALEKEKIAFRREQLSLAKKRQDLETEKSDFEKKLQDFKTEKSDFEQEKQDFETEKLNFIKERFVVQPTENAPASGSVPSAEEMPASGSVPSAESAPSSGSAHFPEGLSESEERLLSYIARDAGCTQKEYAEKMNVSVTTVQRLFARLQKEQILTREGSNRKGTWIITRTIL